MSISISIGDFPSIGGTDKDGKWVHHASFEGIEITIDHGDYRNAEEIRKLIGIEPEFTNEVKDWNIHYLLKKGNHFLEWLAPLGEISRKNFEALLAFYRGKDFSFADEDAFKFMNMVYNHVPGRTGSAYGLGMLVGGSGGGYFANTGDLKVIYIAEINLLKIQAGQYTGRMIGKGGQNVKATQAFFSKVRYTKVKIEN